jgi:hypothetical protein
MFVQQFVTTTTTAIRNDAFDGNAITINFALKAIVSFIPEGDLNLGRTCIGFLANQFRQVASTVGPASACTETNLDRGENGGFARSILAVNEIDCERTVWRSE